MVSIMKLWNTGKSKKGNLKRLFSTIQLAGSKKDPKKLLKVSLNIDQCNVYQFKMVHISKDLRYLYKLKDYEELPEATEELQQAWTDIYNEWSKIVGGNKADLAFLKQKQQFARKYNFDYEITLYRMLGKLPIPELVEQFNELGYNVQIKDYEASMKGAYGKLMKKKAQIEMQEKKPIEGSIDFDSLITTLEKEQGYGFDEYKMTVRKLATIYKQVKDGEGRKDKKK